MSKQVNYNENLCSGAAIRDDKGRRISKLFEASHPKMTVGYAKNLIMPDTPTEQKFNFRQSGGGVIEDGVAVIDKVKGKSVVWNQLAHSSINEWTSKTGLTQSADEIIRQTIPSGQWGDAYPLRGEFKGIIIATARIVSGSRSAIIYLRGSEVEFSSNSWETKALITGSFENLTLQANTSAGDELVVEWKDIQVINLTQMFGAGNEPSTVEEFLSRKPKVADEYAYNEGTIVNNKVEKVVTTGVNLWDESKRVNGKYIDYLTGKEMSSAAYSHTGYVRVLPNTEYYFKHGADEPQYGAYYDVDKNFILGLPNFKGVFTTPAQAAYVRITLEAADSSDNICINLSDPTINGKYFPYEKHELDLSWVKDIKDGEGVKLFEDGMSGVGSVFDVVTATKAIRRFAMIHLGDLRSWTWYSGYAGFYNTSIRDCAKAENIPCLIAGYNVLKDASFNSSRGTLEAAMAWGTENAYLKLRNTAFDSTSTDAFIESLQGKYIIYELAEPVEVEYDEKNLTYPVIAGGTEEAIAIEPSTAFRADIGYGIDAVKTILDLKARVEALEGK